MKKLSLAHGREIYEEMCQRINVDPASIDTKLIGWYEKHTWTEEQQEEFRVWLGKFLVKHKYCGKGKKRGINWGYYDAGKIILYMGWKVDYD